MSDVGVVLDASAFLAALNDEPGADLVLKYTPRSTISTVNLAEVATRLVDMHVPEARVPACLCSRTWRRSRRF